MYCEGFQDSYCGIKWLFVFLNERDEFSYPSQKSIERRDVITCITLSKNSRETTTIIYKLFS